MNSINSSKCFARINLVSMEFNQFASFASLPCVLVPSVKLWNFKVKEILSKCIVLAQFKEGSQCCFRRAINLVHDVTVIEIYSLSIFQMNSQMLDRRMPVVNRKVKYSPICLIGTYPTTILKVGYFIMFLILHLKKSTVTT